jgi:transposase InsO family protein
MYMSEHSTNKQRGPRRSYTEAQRATVLQHADDVGVSQAARDHKVPVSTIYLWRAKKVRAPQPAPSTTEPAAQIPSPSTVEDEISPEPFPDAAPSPHGAEPALERESGVTSGADQYGDVCAPSGSATAAESCKAADGSKCAAPDATTIEEPTSDPVVGQCDPQSTGVPRYTPSQKAHALELAKSHGVGQAASVLGMSRFSIYQWRDKAAKAERGEGPPVTTGDDPADIEAQRDAEIIDEYRRHPGLGPSQIRNQLRRKSIKAGIQTVRRVMEAHGYRPPKVVRRPHDRFYEAIRPNHLWHLDFLQRYINRTSTFSLFILDDHARFIVGHGVDDAERADMVIEAFEAAVQRHGKPEAIMHDRGSAFWAWRGISRFTRFLTELGIDQIVAKHKEHNGKVENFNGNLAKELFDVQRFCDIADMKRSLASHLHWYNHGRTHQALGGLLVPADRYYGRAAEVLAQIASGSYGTDAKDELCLKDRCMSLFSVTQEQGEIIVSIMGERIALSRLTAPSNKA